MAESRIKENHSHCPVLGLPIYKPAEWQNIDLGDGYSTSFKLVGGGILVSSPCGNSGKHGMKNFVQARERFLRSCGLWEKPHVEIKDFFSVAGRTTQYGRKQFTRHLLSEKERGYLKGLIGYNASAFVKWAMNVGNWMYIENFFIKIVGDYKAAIRTAEQIIGPYMAIPEKRHEAGRNWEIQLGGLSLRYKKLYPDTLCGSYRGLLTSDYVSKLFEFIIRVMQESGAANMGDCYVIKDWSKVQIPSWRVRSQITKGYIALQKIYPCRLFVMYGLTPGLKTITYLSRPFFPVPIAITENLEEAISAVHKAKRDGKSIKAKKNRTKSIPFDVLQSDLRDFLQYMGGINWHNESPNSIPAAMDEQHLFSPLYQAVQLVKQDFDSIMMERDSAEKNLREQSKYNKLRADIWGLTYNGPQNEQAMVQQFLNAVGPSLGFDRACFYTYREPYRETADLYCVQEWCEKKVDGIIGHKIPFEIGRRIMQTSEFFITKDSLGVLFEKEERRIFSGEIERFFSEGKILLFARYPFKINNVVVGWFILQSCNGKTSNPDLSERLNELLIETVGIISHWIERKRAAESLEIAYANIEEEVKLRTSELFEANEKLIQAVEKTKEEAARAENANKAKSRFLANMSHEIRTPLNGILGFAELLTQSSLSVKQAKWAHYISNEGETLVDLINQILDLAKVESGKMEFEETPFSLHKLILDCTSTLKLLATKKGINFKTEFEGDYPQYLLGDTLRIRQILVNLVGNAIKFTEKGEVIVRIKLESATEKEVIVKFEVCDTGIGIQYEKQKSIFESFSQADGSMTRKYGGTGLGTTISKQLVDLMRGKMGLESEPGHGSRFWFWVPFKVRNTISQDKQESDEAAIYAALNNKLVLVVEDYPTNRELLKHHLQRVNMNVVFAENGKEALDKFEKHAIDLILMDIQLPEMDGYETTRIIRKLLKGRPLPIVGLTAKNYLEEQQRCNRAGMNGIISKPIKKDQLYQHMAQFFLDQ